MKTSANLLATAIKENNESVVNLHPDLIHERCNAEALENTKPYKAPLWVASSQENLCSEDTVETASQYLKKWKPVVVEPISDKPIGGTLKRIFDIVIAATTLFLLAPILLTVALLIYITQGGPVFFSQKRVGFNRRTFRCFKFRTMIPDAEEKLAQYLATNEEAAVDWQKNQKLKHDPRITWLGHILRKSSLDELPQLFNVLRGEMSCIGPRPVLNEELQRYGIHAREYIKARPGLTGVWQVNGRSNTTYEYRVNCDRYYVRRWSFMLDIRVLFLTIPAIMKFDETA
jgi:exopolysaccharide production protein ExoY